MSPPPTRPAPRRSPTGAPPAMGDFTYAIFEEGCAPLRRQFRVDLPLYIFADALPHVGVNFPYLAPADSGVRPPAFSGGGKTAKFAKIADMDEIVSREFRDGLPVVVARSILSAAVKAGAQFAAQYAVRDNSAALLLVAIARLGLPDRDERRRPALVDDPAEGGLFGEAANPARRNCRNRRAQGFG